MSIIFNLIKNPLVLAGIIAAAIAIPVAVSNSREPPQPNFIADTIEGFAPLEVQFTDESTGDINSWRWDFDDDGMVDSTGQNPSYTYDNPGAYTVLLSVPGEEVDWITETKTNYISVLAPLSASGPTGNMTPPPPQFNIPPSASGPAANITHGPIVANPPPWDYSRRANFSGSPRYGNAPLEAHFTDESTDNFISWIWDFDGDGNVDSSEQNPSHSYVNPGTYTVFLSVSAGNMTWSTETKIDYIVVLSPPHADFYSSKTYGNIPHEVHFTDNSTGDINYWNWDFDGDGNVDSWEQNPSYTYTEAGKYTVSLTVGELTSNIETKVDYITVLDPRGNGDGGGGGGGGNGGEW